MLNALIDFSLKNRFVVLLLAGILIVLGVRSALRLPLDAFPDTTPVQVQINTVAPELSPEEVERLITFPVEYALGGLKGLEEVRSVSKFGLSQVVAIFEDGTDIYFARQQINERLGEVELPEGIDAADDGPGRDGPRRGLPLPPREREPRVRPDRAPDAPGLGDPPAAPARPGRRRGQRLGRARQAVRGPGRPDEARQVRPDARRPDAGPPGRTTRTSAAATSSARASRASSRGSAASAPSTRSPRSSSRRSTACRSASGTSPRSPSATRSAAAASPPSGKGEVVLGSPSCAWARTRAR